MLKSSIQSVPFHPRYQNPYKLTPIPSKHNQPPSQYHSPTSSQEQITGWLSLHESIQQLKDNDSTLKECVLNVNMVKKKSLSQQNNIKSFKKVVNHNNIQYLKDVLSKLRTSRQNNSIHPVNQTNQQPNPTQQVNQHNHNHITIKSQALPKHPEILTYTKMMHNYSSNHKKIHIGQQQMPQIYSDKQIINKTLQVNTHKLPRLNKRGNYWNQKRSTLLKNSNFKVQRLFV